MFTPTWGQAGRIVFKLSFLAFGGVTLLFKNDYI